MAAGECIQHIIAVENQKAERICLPAVNDRFTKDDFYKAGHVRHRDYRLQCNHDVIKIGVLNIIDALFAILIKSGLREPSRQRRG